ncbi:MAG: hypothetical protein K2Y10_03335 [Burkholderiaceae bacterium]|nr:hypothetical protein [Burkholderiaceae bacterium]
MTVKTRQVQTVAARRYLPALQAVVAKTELALRSNAALVPGRSWRRQWSLSCLFFAFAHALAF